ncbi:putative mannose-6-phosphate class i protein [Cladorrhinum sp. PSN259]|nr:putative mannose-6-phosphate class i protein [Cladorrhinum sp. PSN259]
MKTSFFALVASLVSVQQALALPTESTAATIKGRSVLPPGSKEGYYTGSLNARGTTTWHYHGPRNTTATPARSVSSVSDGSAIDKRANFATCENRLVNVNDRDSAIAMLANNCGNGLEFDAKSIAFVVGSVVAYGCNYGNGQICHRDDIETFMLSVKAQCGNRAGWWTEEDWKASYGYTAGGTGFC